MPPRITQESYRPRVSDRTMVNTTSVHPVACMLWKWAITQVETSMQRRVSLNLRIRESCHRWLRQPRPDSAVTCSQKTRRRCRVRRWLRRTSLGAGEGAASTESERLDCGRDAHGDYGPKF